jgi:hypothetical protein
MSFAGVLVIGYWIVLCVGAVWLLIMMQGRMPYCIGFVLLAGVFYL